MTFKEELQEIFPKLENKIIDCLVEKYSNMEDLCKTNRDILEMSLMGIAMNQTNHIYNGLKKKRKELYIDLDDIMTSLKYIYYDSAYNMPLSNTIHNTKLLGELVSIIQSVNQDKAIDILDQIMIYLISDTVDRVQEFAREDDWNEDDE